MRMASNIIEVMLAMLKLGEKEASSGVGTGATKEAAAWTSFGRGTLSVLADLDLFFLFEEGVGAGGGGVAAFEVEGCGERAAGLLRDGFVRGWGCEVFGALGLSTDA